MTRDDKSWLWKVIPLMLAVAGWVYQLGYQNRSILALEEDLAELNNPDHGAVRRGELEATLEGIYSRLDSIDKQLDRIERNK